MNYSKDREVIILRDEEKMDIEYEDTYHIKEMRKLVIYNELLRKTFIDIQEYNIPRIELKEKKERRRRNKPVFVNITHHDKFIRRIFNNSTWDDGGRFYGGWWQRIDGSHRKGIRFNNNPTNINVIDAKYFPITNSCSLIGRVQITSIVPEFFSFEIILIEIAGIKNKYTNGTI